MTLKRIFYKVINPFRKLYWFIFHPTTRGCKMVIEHSGLVLAIRNSYGKGHWTFPGGGVKPTETYLQAALRETQEEVGISLPTATHLGSYTNTKEHKIDHVECFFAHVSTPKFQIDPSEVAEAQWVDPADFPQPASPRAPLILEMLSSHLK